MPFVPDTDRDNLRVDGAQIGRQNLDPGRLAGLADEIVDAGIAIVGRRSVPPALPVRLQDSWEMAPSNKP